LKHGDAHTFMRRMTQNTLLASSKDEVRMHRLCMGSPLRPRPWLP
jgi:hypothetical protein